MARGGTGTYTSMPATPAYYDDEINGVLGLDIKEQFVIYIATVGKKK
jgi:hypothetical protein